jgi:hypothetical protein
MTDFICPELECDPGPTPCDHARRAQARRSGGVVVKPWRGGHRTGLSAGDPDDELIVLDDGDDEVEVDPATFAAAARAALEQSGLHDVVRSAVRRAASDLERQAERFQRIVASSRWEQDEPVLIIAD